MKIIDRKFKILAVNPCNGHIYTEENAVLFCAHDEALPYAINAYIEKCKALQCGTEHIESVELLLERIIEYQNNVKIKIPDTHLPCEIDRCIGGKV